MLVQNDYPGDTRVRNEATALRDAGYSVSVVCCRQPGQPAAENVNGVQVYRIPKISLLKNLPAASTRLGKTARHCAAIAGYVLEYFYFILACFFMSIYLALRRGFEAIHIHTPPNTLFLVGACFRLFGKKFVFDHHDLSPELYLSRFRVQPDFVHRILMLEERIGLRLASLIIATNESYKRLEIARAGVPPEKIFIVRNGPNLQKIKPVAPDEKLRSMGKTILGYVGDINPQDGLDYLLRSLRHLAHDLGRKDFYCVIIGTGDAWEELRILARELELDDHVWFTGYIPFADLLRYLSSADICLDPDPSSPLNDASTWIKIMEYMALRKPIVSFDLPETRYSAQQAAVYVPPNDEKKFAQAIARLMDDPAQRERMAQAGYKRVAEKLAWHHVSQNLLRAYETLLPKPGGRAAPETTSGARPLMLKTDLQI